MMHPSILWAQDNAGRTKVKSHHDAVRILVKTLCVTTFLWQCDGVNRSGGISRTVGAMMTAADEEQAFCD
jgi:hypothetical protein